MDGTVRPGVNGTPRDGRSVSTGGGHRRRRGRGSRRSKGIEPNELRTTASSSLVETSLSLFFHFETNNCGVFIFPVASRRGHCYPEHKMVRMHAKNTLTNPTNVPVQIIALLEAAFCFSFQFSYYIIMKKKLCQ